jgi:predicted DNA-binding ribbon-helix-helix protein
MTHQGKTLADVHLRIDIQHLATRARTRGDETLAAILTSAVRTLDHRIGLADSAGAEPTTEPAPELVRPTIRIFGRDVIVLIEKDFWELFGELSVASGRSPADLCETLAVGRGDKGLASLIRLYVLQMVMERAARMAA